MSRQSIWTADHADFLVSMVDGELSANEMSFRMSKHFKMRVTAAQVNNLLVRIRNPDDQLHRPNVPYRRGGAKRFL